MTFIFFLQLVLPLFLIAWIALAPISRKLGFFCQVIGTATGLFALALTGLWLFPPWWSPYAFAILLVAAVFTGWRRWQPLAARLPSGWKDWIFTAVFIAIGGCGVLQSANALAGRVPQAGTTVDLAFPLKGGTFLVVNGGSHINVNAHLMTLDESMARFHAYRGQSYGVDIVKLDTWGLRANGLQPSAPAAYDIYGVPVSAPVAASC